MRLHSTAIREHTSPFWELVSQDLEAVAIAILGFHWSEPAESTRRHMQLIG